MSFLHGSSAKVYVGGFNITNYLTDFSPTLNGEAVDVTTLGATWHDVIGGLKSFSATANGFYDPAEDTIMLATVNAVRQWMYFPQGDTLGAFGYGMQAVQTSYAPTSPIGGASAFTLSGTGKGTADRIVSLHPLGAETIDEDGASVDNAASSANGGAGYIQATTYSGLTNAIVKIQHSADDAIWVDLITFATITAVPASEVIAVTGTVDRYLRYSINVTGTGSITLAVGFGRR